MEEIIEDAIIHLPDLSFNYNNWNRDDVIVIWDEDKLEYQWLGIKKKNGSKLYFENIYRLKDSKWFFFRGLTFANDYANEEEYHLLNDAGEVLIKFTDEFPSDPVYIDAKYKELFNDEDWHNLTYCFDFFDRVSSRNLEEINFGYDKISVENATKYQFIDYKTFWASCEFDQLATAWNTIDVKSLPYDKIYNFQLEDGTCLVKNNDKFAIINRWFQRITPWFDEFVDNEKLSEIMDVESIIPNDLIAVKINDEVLIIELCGNFVHDKILNPLAFFSDKNFGKTLYDPNVFFVKQDNTSNKYDNLVPEFLNDDIIRINIEEDYVGIPDSVYPDIIPFYLGFMEYFSIDANLSEMQKFAENHNQLMGITPSGYKIKQRFTLKGLNAEGIKTNPRSPFHPGPGSDPKPKSFRFFN